MNNITEKIRNNAIIAYLFILINITFLFSKNSNLNNTFVINHTKTALLIHMGFLINTIIFAYFWLWFTTQILWYNISDIIAISIYLILFFIMIYWVYKAYKYKNFKISETLYFKKNQNLLNITNDWSFSEKDKLTIILSLIPFFWFIIFPKYKTNRLVENNTKLNLISTLIITSLYIFWNPNLAHFLLLIYIIFIVFIWINIFIQNKIINFNLEKIPNSDEQIILLKAFFIYLWKYFSNSKYFEKFSSILEKNKIKNKTNNIKQEKELQEKPDFKLNNYLIYIPILNLISLFNKNVKQQKHIINWIIITWIFIVILLLDYFFWNKYIYILFLIFPIFFGLGYLKAWIMNYEIPFLYNIFLLLQSIKNKIKSIFLKIKTIKNTKKSISLKVWKK